MAEFLGTPDYAARDKEATDLAKLQFALSLMGRGFAAMGAAPQRGESAIGTLGRTLAAPIAGDLSTIAGPLMQQRAAARLAKEQEERQLKLAAYTGQEAAEKELRILTGNLLPKPATPKAANVGYMRHKITGEVQHVVRRGPGQSAYFSVSGDALTDPENWVWVGSTVPSEATSVTEADQNRQDRSNLLLGSMSHYQRLQLPGPFSAYSARSALFFDQSAYLAKKSPWKYIPSGTRLDDRTQDVTITNQEVLELIKNKVDATAQQFLRSDYGDASQETKSSRLAKAIKSILSLPAETLFGASPIEVIGERDGQTVGYSPTAAAFTPVNVAVNAQAAMNTLRKDSKAIPVITFSTLPYPDNKVDINKPWGRAKVASVAFPGAFGNVGAPGTDDYDFGQDQQRRDVESVLPNVRLRADATSDNHKAVIQKAVIQKVAARDKLQNGPDARVARDSFGYALEFRRALLDFKNAAAESNVEGFATGTAAAVAAKLGFADWLAGAGAVHWRRLTIASERLRFGISRRVGKDFGDDRISDLDAQAYAQLVAAIKNSTTFNRILVDDGLRRVNRDMTDLMAYGGKVGWTKRDLKRAAEAGVDFSELSTQMNWHGYGYYGQNRYSSTRQRTPSLTTADRSAIRSEGKLKDTMYGGQYTVPSVNYKTDNVPTFTQGRAASKGNPAVPPTAVLRLDPEGFRFWLEGKAKKAALFGKNSSPEEIQAGMAEMRRRVVRGILRYNIWRNNLR